MATYRVPHGRCVRFSEIPLRNSFARAIYSSVSLGIKSKCYSLCLIDSSGTIDLLLEDDWRKNITEFELYDKDKQPHRVRLVSRDLCEAVIEYIGPSIQETTEQPQPRVA